VRHPPLLRGGWPQGTPAAWALMNVQLRWTLRLSSTSAQMSWIKTLATLPLPSSASACASTSGSRRSGPCAWWTSPGAMRTAQVCHLMFSHTHTHTHTHIRTHVCTNRHTPRTRTAIVGAWPSVANGGLASISRHLIHHLMLCQKRLASSPSINIIVQAHTHAFLTHQS
jgi:hypothetical protein